MRTLVALAALAACLIGCGGAEEPAVPQDTVTVTTTPSPTELGMREACPLLEQALKDADLDMSVGQVERLIATVDRVAELGDLETRNAIDGLQPGLRSLRKFANEGGIPVGYRDGLQRRAPDARRALRGSGILGLPVALLSNVRSTIYRWSHAPSTST